MMHVPIMGEARAYVLLKFLHYRGAFSELQRVRALLPDLSSGPGVSLHESKNPAARSF